MTTGAAPRLMDRRAVATYLGVHPATVDNLRARGVLPPPVPLIGGEKKAKPMWDRRDIDACIDALKRAQPNDTGLVRRRGSRRKKGAPV